MPSWNDPSNTNPVHTNVLEDLGKKDTYALTMGQEDPGYTDLPTGTMTWDNNQKILRRREGGTPLPAVLSLAGGGTGAADAAGARTVLQVNKSGVADGEARTNAQNDLRYVKLVGGFDAIKEAATSSYAGVVKLGNTLTSTATDTALTTAQGKVLKDSEAAINQRILELENDRYSFQADWNGSIYSVINATGSFDYWVPTTDKISTGKILVEFISGLSGYNAQATPISSGNFNATIERNNSRSFYVYLRNASGTLVDGDVFVSISRQRSI